MPPPRGYVRETRYGMPVARQIDALRAAGVAVDEKHAPVYIDRLPDLRPHRASPTILKDRGMLVEGLRAGERVVVASLDRLGVSAGDIRRIVDAVIDRGAEVYVADTGAVYNADTPRGVLSAATIAAETALKSEKIRKAANVRRERIAAGVTAAVGGNRGWHPTPEEDASARAMWNDTSLTQAQVSAAVGVTPITLRRRFGPRGTPRGRRKIQSA